MVNLIFPKLGNLKHSFYLKTELIIVCTPENQKKSIKKLVFVSNEHGFNFKNKEKNWNDPFLKKAECRNPIV